MKTQLVLTLLTSSLEATDGFGLGATPSYLNSLSTTYYHDQGEELTYAAPEETRFAEEVAAYEQNFNSMEYYGRNVGGTVSPYEEDTTYGDVPENVNDNVEYSSMDESSYYDNTSPPAGEEENDYLYWLALSNATDTNLSNPTRNLDEDRSTNVEQPPQEQVSDAIDDFLSFSIGNPNDNIGGFDTPRSCLEQQEQQANDQDEKPKGDEDFLLWMVEYMFDQEEQDKDYNVVEDENFWNAVAQFALEETQKAASVEQWRQHDHDEVYHPVAQNALGTALRPCGPNLMGKDCNFCNLGDEAQALTVCCELSRGFLESPYGEYLRQGNLQPGDVGCINADLWMDAYDDEIAPPVFLESTNALALKEISLEFLRAFALDHQVGMERVQELQQQRAKLNKIFRGDPAH